jgi:hypothetical protein
VKQKVALKDKKKLGTKTSKKFNDVSSADGNKYKIITVDPSFNNSKQAVHLIIDRRLRSCTCF